MAALPAATTWEIRTAGNANNGGCFVAGASGTDYSQQDANQYTFTDLVLVTTTTVSSASHAFDANDIGNCLHITAGVNFTAGFYQIVSQAAGVATLDRAAGTMGSTGGTFFVGGAVVSLATVLGVTTSFNTVWMKNDATYSVAAGISDNTTGLVVRGYGSTRGDQTRVTLQATANSITILTISNAGLFGAVFTDINFDCASRTGVAAISTNNGAGKLFQRIKASSCITAAITLGGNGSATCIYCVVTGQNGGIGFTLNSFGQCFSCYFLDPGSSTGVGFSLASTASTCIDCVGEGHASATGADVYAMAGQGVLVNSSCFNAGRDCLRITCAVNCGGGQIINFVAYTAGGWCVNQTSTVNPAMAANYVAFANCTSGNSTGITVGNSITLTANPYADTSTNNFALNNTAGGGAAVKQQAFPGVTDGGTGYLDMGGLQSRKPQSVFGGAN